MRTFALIAAFAASLSACAPGTATRGPAMPTDSNPDVRQYPGERVIPRSSPVAPDEKSAPAPAPSAHPLKGMQFEVPAGWSEVTEQAPHPKSVIAVFMHDGPPLGVIAVDVLVSGEQSMQDTMRQLSRDIEDAKVVLRSDVSPDGMRGSISWTTAVDGSGSSGHGELVRFPNRPGVTVAFLGFWESKDHDTNKPAVQSMAASAKPPADALPAK